MKQLSIYLSIIIGITILSNSCNSSSNETVGKYQVKKATDSLIDGDTVSEIEDVEELILDTFSRTQIIKTIKHKKSNNIPLIIHVFVPLCDNDNQGIVPTSKSLGDGLNLKTNLYWAVKGSTRYDFLHDEKWTRIYNKYDVDSNILERIAFERIYNETKVFLIADAYRGDRMEETVNDFLASISNNRQDSIKIKSGDFVKCSGYADLFIFNGHNGMMDPINVHEWINTDQNQRDVVINACATYYHFQDELIKAMGYPLVRTNTLLHPGAYVLTQIVDDWVNGVQADTLCLNAGQAYCRVQKCGTGSKIYAAGW